MPRIARFAPLLLAATTGVAAIACTSSGASNATGPSATSAPSAAAATTTTTTATGTGTTKPADGDAKTSTTTKGGTTSTQAATSNADLPGIDADGQITDGTVLRTFMFNMITEWGKQADDPEQARDPEQLAKGLNVTFPSLDLSGYAVDATPTRISLMSTNVKEKADPSAANPYVIAFAIKQVDGACIGGVISGYPEPTTTMSLRGDAQDTCNASYLFDHTVDRIPTS